MNKKRFLIIFIMMIISIIPTLKVEASFNVRLNDGENLVFSDLPDEYQYGDNFIILKNDLGNYSLFILYGDNYTFNLEHATNNYFTLAFDRTDDINNDGGYRLYHYINNEWVDKTSLDKPLYGVCHGSCRFPYSSSLGSGTRNADKKFTQVVFSTTPVRFKQDFNSNYLFIENSNFDVSSWSANDIVYNADAINNNYLIKFDSDKRVTSDGNFEYWNLRIYTDEFHIDYHYFMSLDGDYWENITNLLEDDGFEREYFSNGTVYFKVLDNNYNILGARTFVISDLIDSSLNNLPTATIDVHYSTDYSTNLEQANIKFNFNNYSSSYIYQYSFNDIDYIDISYSDINNKSYSIISHTNGIVYLKIKNIYDDVVFKTSLVIEGILDSDKYYYYFLTIDDLYNSENNELIYYSFYYENNPLLGKHDITPFISFSYEGTDNLPFNISYNTNVIDLTPYFSFFIDNNDNLNCTNLPWEFVDTHLSSPNYTSYSVFTFTPCIDLSTFLYGIDYNDFKLIIKSNINLRIGEPISYNGAFLSSTNKPYDKSNSFQSNFVNFFKIFNDSFDTFKNVILDIFQNCTYFYNNLNVLLKDFFIVIFAIVLFLFLIKFIL